MKLGKKNDKLILTDPYMPSQDGPGSCVNFLYVFLTFIKVIFNETMHTYLRSTIILLIP